MPLWPARNRSEPEAGDYAVFHERPHPERLERVFSIAAIVVGSLAGLAVAVFVFSRPQYAEPARNIFMAASAFVIAFGLTWAPVRGLGMAVAGIVKRFRPKEYVVDWHAPPTIERERRPILIFFAGMGLVVLWAFAASRWL